MEEKPARPLPDRSSRENKRRRTPRTSQPRRWTIYAPPTNPEDPTAPVSARTFRVMSFNVLADYIVLKDRENEPAKRHQKFDWEYRRDRLMREILHWAPQIVCLQEVDHFEDFFQPRMNKAGFVGVYKRRTGETTHDGCAIFVKKSVFHIVSTHPLEYFEEAHAVLDRHNIALAVVLERKAENSGSAPRRFVVSTTHLLYNPGRGDVKLAQLNKLLSFLADLRSQHNPLLPLLLCGDFNLTPSSALYHFLSKGELEVTGLPRATLSGQNMSNAARKAALRNEHDLQRHSGNGTAIGRFDVRSAYRNDFRTFRASEEYSHSFDFASAYAQSPDDWCTGEPKFTVFHSSTKATVDYIWFTRSLLHCHGVVEMIPAGLLFANGSELPTKDHSSDHMSLVADFSLRL